MTEPVAKPLLLRAFQVYWDARYEGLTEGSNCHLYNLRCSKAYTRVLGSRDAMLPSQVPTGPGRKPRPEGRQGWGGAGSMHQGNLDKVKGVYRINAVDKVAQS